MNIGFDAKRAFNNFTGLGNYSRTLVETLARYYTDNSYHLFTPNNHDNPSLNFIKNQPSISIHTPPQYLRAFHPYWRSFTIKKDIEKANIDIFHGLSHELPFKMPSKVKTVVTIHDLIHERYPEYYPYLDRKIYSFKFKKACEMADVVVAISEQTKRDIVDFYKIEDSKIRVIYQSCHRQFYIDQSPFSNKDSETQLAEKWIKKYKLPENYILYVGTINERKNVLSLIKAMQLIDFKEDMKLLVVGGGHGAYFEMVKKHVLEKGLRHKVIFIHNADFEDFPFFYKNAQAFVLPSAFEGFGLPIIEALWSGCPVITSEGSCFSEAGGADSLYVNPLNPESIANAINRVLWDKALKERMILRGEAFVKKFHEVEIGRQWMDLYKGLVSKWAF